MDIDKIRDALARALPMRPPRFSVEEGQLPPSGGQKVAALEDYLLDSAFVAAELEEALHWLDAIVEQLKEKIENLTGYELALPRKSPDRLTRNDILTAKRSIDRPTFEAGAEARQLRTSVLRQIERLRFEEQWVISRAYSLISGS